MASVHGCSLGDVHAGPVLAWDAAGGAKADAANLPAAAWRVSEWLFGEICTTSARPAWASPENPGSSALSRFRS